MLNHVAFTDNSSISYELDSTRYIGSYDVPLWLADLTVSQSYSWSPDLMLGLAPVTRGADIVARGRCMYQIRGCRGARAAGNTPFSA